MATINDNAPDIEVIGTENQSLEMDQAAAEQSVDSAQESADAIAEQENEQILSEIEAIQAAIEANEDPIEEVDTAAGESSHGGISLAVALARDGKELIAATDFETEAFEFAAQEETLINTDLNTANGNIAPTISVENAVLDEDSGSVTLSYSTADEDGSIVSTSASVPAEQGSVSIDETAGTITFTPADNFHGDATITLVTSDNSGATTESNATVTVVPVNDAPTIDSVVGGTQAAQIENIAEAGDIVATFIASDFDGDPVTFSISSGNDDGYFVIDADTGVVSLTAAGAAALDNDALTDSSYTIGVTANDGTLDSAEATTVIDFVAVNDAPTIDTAEGSTQTENTAQAGDVVATFTASDLDGDDISFAISSGNDDGYFVIDADTGVVTLTAVGAAALDNDALLDSSYTIGVTANDGTVDSAEATAEIIFDGVNDIPTFGSGDGVDAGTVTEDLVLTTGGTLTIDDADAGEETFVEQTDITGEYGTFSINESGEWTYTLDNDSDVIQSLNAASTPLTDTFTVTSADGSTHNISVSINGTDGDDTAPVVDSNQSISYAENQSAGVVGTVTASDAVGVTGYQFANGTTTSNDGYFTIAANGEISITAAGIAEGVAQNDFETGANSFGYSIQALDGSGNVSDAVTVTLNVTNVDDTAPTLMISSDNTSDLAVGETATITFTFSEEVDGFEAGDITVVGGSLSGLTTSDNITWTATFTQSGSDTPSISVADNSYSDLAGNNGSGDTLALTADDTAPVVDSNQSISYAENQSAGVVGTVAASDAVGVTGYQFANGTTTSSDGYFTIAANGEISITDAGIAAGVAQNDFETGANSFDYSIQALDDAGNVSDAVAVSLVVEQVNEAPVISVDNVNHFSEDAGAAAGDVVATFTTSDPENDSLTITLSDTSNYVLGTGANAGKVLLTADGLALVNAGSELPAFTLIANDGELDSNIGYADPSVTPTDDATLLTLSDGSAIEDTTEAGAVLASFSVSDEDSTGITVDFSAGSNDNGYYVIDGSEVKLTAAGEAYLDAGNSLPNISLTTSTGVTASNTVTTTLVNDDPVALNDVNNVDENATLIVSKVDGVIETNDTDLDSETITVTAIRTGAEDATDGTAGVVSTALTGIYGTLTLAADGSYTYIADQAATDAIADGATATDTFTYTISDGEGGTDSAEINITVTGKDDASVTMADVNITSEDTTLTVAAADGVLSNDSDVDNVLSVVTFMIAGDTATYNAGSSATIAGKGELTVNTDGSYEFVPASNYAGDIPVITYTTNTGVSDTLTLSVTPVADTLDPSGVAVVIGEDLSSPVTDEGATDISDDLTSMTLANGIKLNASGPINLSNGLGVSVDSAGGTGEEANRIDNDAGTGSEFITMHFQVGMQSMSMGVKNTKNDILLLTSKDVAIDTSEATITVTGTLGGGDFTGSDSSVTLIITSDAGITEVSTDTFTLDSNGNYAWSVSYDASGLTNISNTAVAWEVDGSVFSNGGDTLDLYIDADMAELTFANAESSTGDGYQINDLFFATGGSASHTYPIAIDMNALLTDTDGSEHISEVYLSGFPAGSSITVVTENEDGSTTETDIPATLNSDGNTVFIFEEGELLDEVVSNHFGQESEFNDQIYLTTTDELPADFAATIAVTTTDTVDGITDQAYTMLGGSDSATFTGSDGNDYIDGGAGDDNLNGGAGNDILIGGGGADTFIWSDGEIGIDHIRDFSIADGDKLDLSDLLDVQSGDNLNEFLDFSFDGTDTTISIHADGAGSEVTQTIVLDGVDLGSDDVTIINDLFNSDNSGALIISDDPDVNASVEVAPIPEE